MNNDVNESQQYYIKVGKRYKPVDRFDGFPTDGVWIVKNSGSNQSLMLNLPDCLYTGDELKRIYTKTILKDKMVGVILDELLNGEKNISPVNKAHRIADKIIRSIYDEETK